MSINHKDFPTIKYLKKLRNRVHIQQSEHSTDHDYNSFNKSDVSKTKKALYNVLTCKEICINNIFEFLLN